MRRLILGLHLWSSDNLKDVIKHLSPASQGEENLARGFMLFCQQCTSTLSEVRILLTNHLKPSELHANINAKTEAGERPGGVNWNNADNAAYRYAVNDLCDAMREAFVNAVDYSIINPTRQRTSEVSTKCLTRLQAVFDENNGVTRPGDFAELLPTIHETHQKSDFI